MKQHKLNNLIEDLQRVKMTREEKSEVLARSWSAIAKIESVHQFSIGTGRVVEVGKHHTSVASTFQNAWYSYIFEKKFIPALSFALLLVITGGTSLAAENSLPGDILYSVKTGLNEQVRGFTAVTPEAKAKFALEVTDRRLKEVSLLSSKGLLNEKTSLIVQGQLQKQAGQIKNQVASLVSTKNIRAAQEISLNFESSLRAHELILEKISTKQSEQSDTLAVAANHSLIASIKTQIATTTAARTLLQADEVTDASLDAEKLLARITEIKLKAVEIKRIASTTPVSSSARASTSLIYIGESDKFIMSADQKIASSSYAEALLDLQKAIQYLVDAETLLGAPYSSDPLLNSLINEALSSPNFSQAGNISTSTPAIDTNASTTTSSTTSATSSGAVAGTSTSATASTTPTI